MHLPLKQLHAFEAVARCNSLTAAAAELSVTPGAISQQIRKLEEHLDCQLFVRSNRSLALTREGSILASALTPVFQQITSALGAINSPDAHQGLVRVVAYPTHARRVLIPALPRFQALYPRITLQVSASHWIVDRPGDCDLVMRAGAGDWTSERSIFLHRPPLTPVCSPAYLEQHPISEPSDLASAVLLQSQNRLDDWPTWFKAAGVSKPLQSSPILFGNSDLSYEATLAGAGVAIGQSSLLLADLKAGRLIAPFGITCDNTRGYYLLLTGTPPPHVIAFAEWYAEAVQAVEDETRRFLADQRQAV